MDNNDFQLYVTKKFEKLDKLDNDFSEFKADTTKRLDKLESNVSGLKADVSELKYEFSDMKLILRDVTNNLIKLEYTINEKIPPLYDAFSSNLDQHTQYEKNFQRIQKYIAEHSTKIDYLTDSTTSNF